MSSKLNRRDLLLPRRKMIAPSAPPEFSLERFYAARATQPQPVLPAFPVDSSVQLPTSWRGVPGAKRRPGGT